MESVLLMALSFIMKAVYPLPPGQPGADLGGEELDDHHQHDHRQNERPDHRPPARVDALNQRCADAARADNAQRRRVLDIDVKAVDDGGDEVGDDLRQDAVADLLEGGAFDYDNIKKAINEKTKLVTIQRSKGYQTRPSFSVSQIGELIAFVKSIKPDVICMVDNCYGEFVETIEPSDVGADMVVGSLIKNPGGGLAPIGGYIAGRKDLIDNCGYRLTSPGLGKEVGASLGVMQSFFQGLFLAPTVTAGALKGAIFAANIYEKLGYSVIPNGTESRHDIIQAVELGTPEGVIAFCKGIQAAAPVDSYVTPEPWPMPGYDSDVIMAAGAFVQGSSIELSADGPIKEPYAVYFQGGLTWQHAKLGILMSLEYLVREDLVTEL